MRRFLTLFLMLLVTLRMMAEFVVDPMQLGARGDGKTDDAVAIQQAIDQCSAEGGGIVIFSPGHTYLCGPVRLKSNVVLFLTSTSVLRANPDESVYRLSAFGANEIK